ncbi:transposable element Tc1 transposase [Trichonephila clavipes]|nr:transposable element Tc1 transposase [Trichonephila clavipes]
MTRRRIQAHYEQLQKFERGHIIGLKETGFGQIGESLIIWVEAMLSLKDAGKNGWTVADFSVMMCPNDQRRCVWRRPGQRADPAFLIARHTGLKPRVMAWDAISFDSRRPLVIIRGTLLAQRYVDDILRTVLLLLQYPGLIFQQYNARLHTTRAAMNCLTACQTLPWPARSPDLSQIEHVWNRTRRRLHLLENVDDVDR